MTGRGHLHSHGSWVRAGVWAEQRLSESSLAGRLGLVVEGTQLLLVAELESTWSPQSMRCGVISISSAHSVRSERTRQQEPQSCAYLVLPFSWGCYQPGGPDAASLCWMVPRTAGHAVALAVPLDTPNCP